MIRSAFIITALTGSLVCVFFGIIAWRRRPSPGAGYIAGALFSAAVYAFGYGFELSSSDLPSILGWLRFEYLGIVSLPPFWMAAALCYTNHLVWLKRPRIFLLWIIPFVVLAAFYTNPLHQLYYVNTSLDTSGPFPVIDFGHGPLYLLQLGYIFFVIAASSFLLFKYLLYPHPLYRRQSGLILASNILIFLVVTLYFAGIQPVENLDIVVFAVIAACVIVGFGLVRYHLVDFLPTARDMLFDRLSDGVLVLDAKNRLIDFNPEAQRLFSLDKGSIGVVLHSLFPEDLRPAFQDLNSICEHREYYDGRNGPSYFEINCTPIPGIKGEVENLLVMVHEITSLKKMHISLAEMNARLDERVQTRTQEYLQTIDRLEEEVSRRKKTEQELQEMQSSLVERVSVQARRLYSLYDVLINKEIEGKTGEVLGHTFERILQMMNADAVCIHEVRDGRMYRTGSAGLTEEVANDLDILEASWLEDGKPLVSSNLAAETRLPRALRLALYSGYLAAPILVNGKPTGVLQIFWREKTEILLEDISYFSILAEQIGIILENERLRKKLEERAVQGERRRLARDLHDSVTQSLHSLLLNVGVLQNRIERGRMDKVGEMLARLEQSAHQALKEMRLLLFELRIAPLEDVRLVEALKNRLEAVEIRAGMDARIEVDEDACWHPAWEMELYCIAMEALNNSLKHARATQILVELHGRESWADMKITDNGRGFAPEVVKQTGIGLQSMQERASRLGGRLVIESAENRGTSICLQAGSLPVETKGEAPCD